MRFVRVSCEVRPGAVCTQVALRKDSHFLSLNGFATSQKRNEKLFKAVCVTILVVDAFAVIVVVVVA